MARNVPQPRARYRFDKMAVDEVMRVSVPSADPEAGERALNAAYAYARRNGWRVCGAHETQRGVTRMLIRRVA